MTIRRKLLLLLLGMTLTPLPALSVFHQITMRSAGRRLAGGIVPLIAIGAAPRQDDITRVVLRTREISGDRSHALHH